MDMPWSEALIDFSAVHEYMKAHYNQSEYFAGKVIDCDVEAGPCPAMEQIYDARKIQQKQYSSQEREMLRDYGFALLHSPTKMNTNTNTNPHTHTQSDWLDWKNIQKTHLPELQDILSVLFPNKIMHCFWNPMVRGESYEISRSQEEEGNTEVPTANIAPMVHIDTDIGAYENIDALLNLVENNKMQVMATPTHGGEVGIVSDNGTCTNGDCGSVESTFDADIFADAVTRGKKRFAIINFWRNIGDAPVTRAPLAILSTKYSNHDNDNGDKTKGAFPDAAPDLTQSKWHVFPNVTRDEVIVFYQYDRLISQPSDLYHCAISSNRDQDNVTGNVIGRDGSDHGDDQSGRVSFDIRALVLLDEEVPLELDRFNPMRTRPILSLEESGCFCDEQAEKRN